MARHPDERHTALQIYLQLPRTQGCQLLPVQIRLDGQTIDGRGQVRARALMFLLLLHLHRACADDEFSVAVLDV